MRSFHRSRRCHRYPAARRLAQRPAGRTLSTRWYERAAIVPPQPVLAAIDSDRRAIHVVREPGLARSFVRSFPGVALSCGRERAHMSEWLPLISIQQSESRLIIPESVKAPPKCPQLPQFEPVRSRHLSGETRQLRSKICLILQTGYVYVLYCGLYESA